MIKLLIGGSPCTHWSVAQTKNRETKADGIGWELFKNYEIAKKKFQPNFFLYENNWSASKEIKNQIQEKLDCKLMRINSRLVSAQSRDRFYVFNWDIEQPKDRGILLRDILETGEPYTTTGGKSFCITATEYKGSNPQQTIEKHRRTMVAETFELLRIPEATKQGCVDIKPGECVDLAMEHSKTRRGRKMGDKANCLTTTNGFYEYCGTVDKPIYEVRDGMITIKDKVYPIKLRDGYYIIRKLTPVECERLQTMPDGYTEYGAVENNEANYKL